MSLLTRLFRKLLTDFDLFSHLGSGIQLRSYQQRVCAAILHSIDTKAGMTFVVVFPRQSGKNEMQAQLESFLLARHSQQAVEIVKVAPTWVPQSRLSMRRLQHVLDTNAATRGRWRRESSYIFRLGSARITFLSGSPTSNVVGATASLLLECDEAQSVLPSKWDKDFAPMAASTKTTTVFWGTAWTSKTLLAREMRTALLKESHDNLPRVFIMNADQVAREVPDYGAHVAEQLAPILAEGRDDLELEITALQELNQRLFRLAAGISSWSTHLLLSETYSHSISRLNRMMNLNRQNLQSAQPHWLKDLHKIAAQLVEWGELQPQELENFPWGSTAASPSPYQSADTILQENIARLRFMMRKAYENAHRLKDPADLMRMIDGYGLMGIKLAHLLELKSSAGDNLESLRERAIHEALKR